MSWGSAMCTSPVLAGNPPDAVNNLPNTRVWIRSDWEVVLHGPREISSAVQALVRHGHEVSQTGRFLWSSLSQDPKGLELARALRALDAALQDDRLVLVVLDVPRHSDPSLILEEFRQPGLNCSNTLPHLRPCGSNCTSAAVPQWG